ncbi:MAG: hypothetical protein ACLGRW_19595 [Acidobacteriota bacterium]
MLPPPSIFRIRKPSLTRGTLLALGALAASLYLAGFPNTTALHGSRWHLLAVPAVCWAMVETGRCIGPKRNLYYAGVLILLYSELMILALVVFFSVYL